MKPVTRTKRGRTTNRRITRRKRTKARAQKTPNKSVTSAIVPVTQAPIVDYLRKEAVTAPSIVEYAKKHREIRNFLRRNLKLGIDYDQIPGTNGKTLLQPGAERIAVWLKVRPLFDTVESDVGNGHIEVVIRCHLVPLLVYDLIMQVIEKGGANVDQSVAAIIRASELSNASASCTTMETNFRYRWADMRDEDGNPIKPNKLEASRKIAVNMARWLPAKMHFGKIVPLNKNDQKKGTPVEYWLYQERVEHPNIFDERNKVRQMGEKRSFVKAIKRMGALSEVFQEDPNEWPETLDVKPETPPEEPFKAGVVERQPSFAKPGETVTTNNFHARETTKPQGHISVIWQDKDVARITGDDTRLIEPKLVSVLMAIKLAGKQEFILQAIYVPKLFELCALPEVNIQVTETQMKPSEHKPRPASDACIEEVGTIKNVKQSSGKGTPNAQVLFNGAWLYCYSKTIWPELFAGINKEARLLVLRKEGRAPTVEGLIQVGSVYFEADGKTRAA